MQFQPSDYIHWSLSGAVGIAQIFLLRAASKFASGFLTKIDTTYKAVITLQERVKDLSEQVDELGDMKADIAVLNYRVFGKPRKPNGHDAPAHGDTDSDT